MNKLIPIEHKNQRVLTTKQIAEAYETDVKVISKNFNNNDDHYVLGKHYFVLEGEDIKTFFANVKYTNANSKTRKMYLWTERGALLHAKSLNTDKAWQVYDHLVETYFKAKEMFIIPKTLPEALRYAAELAEQIEANKPKVLFADTCMGSKDSILIRELAKLCSKEGFIIGQNKLFRQLRKWGMLNSQNEPYQQYIDQGYFEVIERAIHANEGVILKFTTKVTPKGQLYLLKKLKHVSDCNNVVGEGLNYTC